MNIKKQIKVVLAGSCVLLASNVYAETLTGAQILEQEASRARELQNLEYQAELLEQRTRVATAYKKLKASGGSVPDGFTGAYDSDGNVGVRMTSAPDKSRKKRGATASVPQLKKMMGRSALFETDDGQVVARAGMLLPGGYKLLSLDVASGAKLEKDGMIYLSSMEW